MAILNVCCSVRFPKSYTTDLLDFQLLIPGIFKSEPGCASVVGWPNTTTPFLLKVKTDEMPHQQTLSNYHHCAMYYQIAVIKRTDTGYLYYFMWMTSEIDSSNFLINEVWRPVSTSTCTYSYKLGKFLKTTFFVPLYKKVQWLTIVECCFFYRVPFLFKITITP